MSSRRPLLSFAPLVAVLAVTTAPGCEDETDPTLCTPSQQTFCYEGPEGTEGVGACRQGLQTCSKHGDELGVCQGQVVPVEEDCLTPVDDDCDGEVNEDCVCVPRSYEHCYTGTEDTLGVGACRHGFHRCDDDGFGFGPCEEETLPGDEDCSNPEDEDCDGTANEAEVCACSAGQQEACYSGPDGTEGVGSCVAGVRTCVPEGGAFGPCEGEVLPEEENCSTPEDDDCDGDSNEPETPCECDPGDTRSCYSGPSSTLGEGMCATGTQECVASGFGYGACEGDVTPTTENCSTPEDDDCDGTANEVSAGCECLPGTVESCYSGPDFTSGVGVCKHGMRTCSQTAKWGTCFGEIVPELENCETSVDEDCDGNVNEPAAGCFCGLEYPQSLADEDCIANYGEPVTRMRIGVFPHEMRVHESGTSFLLSRYVEPMEEPEPDPGEEPPPESGPEDYEPVPLPHVGVALIGAYLPNGDLFWGKQLTGSVAPPLTGASHLYNLHLEPTTGDLAFTAPMVGMTTSALGEFDEWTWPSNTFRVLYSLDATGFPYFAVSVPRYNFEAETALHAVAASGNGAVYYVNGPVDSHLIRYDEVGDVAWNHDLNVDLDDLAIAALPDGGVILTFTTTATSLDFGTGELLLPVGTAQQDLVVVRYTEDGDVLWAIRPSDSPNVHAALFDAGVLSIAFEGGLLRIVATDAYATMDEIELAQVVLTAEAVTGSAIPSSSFSFVGTNAITFVRTDVPATNFGMGTLAPYANLATGDFMALREVGGTRWARAPLADDIVIAGAAPNIVVGAFRVTEAIDLDGNIEPLDQPEVFLARLAY